MLYLLISFSEIMASKLPLFEMRKIKAAKKDSGAESSARPTTVADDTMVVPIPDTTQSASLTKKRKGSVDPKTTTTASQPASKKPKFALLAKKKKQIKGTSDDKWFDSSRDIEEETLWGRAYKEGEFIDNFLIHEADVVLIEKQGAGSTYQAMEAYNLRAAALARLAEEERKKVVRWAKKMKVENESMKGEFAKVEAMKKELEEARKNCNLLAEANKDLFVSNNKLNEYLEKSNNLIKLSEEAVKSAEEARSQAESKLENSKKSIHDLETSLSTSNAKWEAEKEELKEALTDQYIAGFDSAVAQVHVVLPEEDISEVGIWKKIVDGRLVEVPENEGNGGNNPDS